MFSGQKASSYFCAAVVRKCNMILGVSFYNLFGLGQPTEEHIRFLVSPQVKISRSFLDQN